MSLKEIGYNITTDPHFFDKQNAITKELSDNLEMYYHLALGGEKSSIKILLDAIEQHPKNPQLKNYLSVLYCELNENQKMYDVNRLIIEEHPDYLYGKLNLANEYYLKEEYEKIPEILGNEMELKALYPKRDTFHLDEVIAFLKIAALYFIGIEDLDQAEIRCKLMQDLEPDGNSTNMMINRLFVARMEAGHKRYLEEQKNKISVKIKQQKISTDSTAPKFQNPEIDWLYSNGLYIGNEKLDTILSLPKNTLIQDLELVLQDSINRYSYFNQLVENDDWDEEKMNFVVHAIYLLGELEAVESINAIFNVLSQSEEYLELYLGDFVSYIWEPLTKIASNNLEACKHFMFKPGVDTYSKCVFGDLAENIAILHPERHDEVINWFSEIFKFFLNSKLEDNVIDSDLIGLLICNVIDIKGAELLLLIKKLFDKEIVSIGVCGNWKEVEKAFKRRNKYKPKREILTISERYKNITTTWAGYKSDESMSNFNFDNYSEPKLTPVRTEPKIGRNEPCPCGSGKKYKKCCLNK